jgi:hypothetical protein
MFGVERHRLEPHVEDDRVLIPRKIPRMKHTLHPAILELSI